MIYQALAFPAQCLARWTALYAQDNFGDAEDPGPVTTDLWELAHALKNAGYPVAFALPAE